MRHLSVLRRRSATSVLALPVRPGRAAALIAEGFTVIADWSEARDRGATHAVIATATGRHAADVVAAAQAGCHVLVEKPLAVDAAAAREAVAGSTRAGRGVWVGCCLRFRASLQRFAQRLPEIGRVHAVRIECQSYLPDWRPGREYRDAYSASADEGGVLRDLIHEIDYAGWLYGWPSALQARLSNSGRLGIAAEDAADLLWHTDTGATVSVRLDYLSRPPRRRMRASGESGTLCWDGITNTVRLAPAAGPVSVERHDEGRDDMYTRQDAAFVEATPGQFDARLATAADGVRALAVCDAARRASADRRHVTVEQG